MLAVPYLLLAQLSHLGKNGSPVLELWIAHVLSSYDRGY